MKGNHEFDATDIAPPVCGGDRKRGSRPRQTRPERKRVFAGCLSGQRDFAGAAAPGDFDALERYAAIGSGSRTGQHVTSIMEGRALQFIIDACSGLRLSGSPMAVAARVCTDSRQIQAGDVFFALRGERFDGHEFVGEVAKKGAIAVVLERGRDVSAVNGCAMIAVDDTRKALGQLAARYRHEFELPIVAVGGSNGKTTTKELIASVLKQKLSTLWSEASFNNDIGVPLTLLKLDKDHEAAVLEVGTNHPGELAPLVRMMRPHYGVITTIGREHLEFFGDINGVVQEEGCLAVLLLASGKIFLNGDNQWSETLLSRSRATAVRVGFGP